MDSRPTLVERLRGSHRRGPRIGRALRGEGAPQLRGRVTGRDRWSHPILEDVGRLSAPPECATERGEADEACEPGENALHEIDRIATGGSLRQAR